MTLYILLVVATLSIVGIISIISFRVWKLRKSNGVLYSVLADKTVSIQREIARHVLIGEKETVRLSKYYARECVNKAIPLARKFIEKSNMSRHQKTLQDAFRGRQFSSKKNNGVSSQFLKTVIEHKKKLKDNDEKQ